MADAANDLVTEPIWKRVCGSIGSLRPTSFTPKPCCEDDLVLVDDGDGDAGEVPVGQGFGDVGGEVGEGAGGMGRCGGLGGLGVGGAPSYSEMNARIRSAVLSDGERPQSIWRIRFGGPILRSQQRTPVIPYPKTTGPPGRSVP